MVEKGGVHVAIGAYANVLFTLGLEKDLLKLAGEDQLGRKLQDAGLETKKEVLKKIIIIRHFNQL